MTAINAGRAERNRMPLRRNTSNSTEINTTTEQRYATDKFWIILLIAAIVFISIRPPFSECKSKVEINKTEKCRIESNSTVKTRNNNTLIEYASIIWGQNWMFDLITLNVNFLDANYDKGGSIVIWANLLFNICLIIYAFTSMRTYGRRYRFQTNYCLFILAIVTITIRLTFVLSFKLTTKSEGILWSIPEIIVLIIACTKAVYSDRDSADVKIKSNLGGFLFYPLFSLGLFSLLLSPISDLYTGCIWNWGDTLPVKLATILTCCYIYLTIYYYLLMVTYCAANLSFNKTNDDIPWKSYIKAYYIVARYHLGTVCYHATVILPRIHTTFIMMSTEFNEKSSKLSIFQRFYFAHTEIHGLSMTMTSISSYNHSKSIRELLQFFINNPLPESITFQTHRKTIKYCSVLLITIYNLMILSLWVHGVIIDPRLTTAIWFLYFIAMYIMYMIIRQLDAIEDVIIKKSLDIQTFNEVEHFMHPEFQSSHSLESLNVTNDDPRVE